LTSDWEPTVTPVWNRGRGVLVIDSDAARLIELTTTDGKLILLDENGQLTLATVEPEGLTSRSRHTVMEKYSLTAPALVGTTLFVRDRKRIVALVLG
jgi:hypothetical protein